MLRQRTEEVVGACESITAAYQRWYRPERLNRYPGALERKVADTAKELEQEATALIASRHESLTGQALYLRKAGAELEVLHID